MLISFHLCSIKRWFVQVSPDSQLFSVPRPFLQWIFYCVQLFIFSFFRSFKSNEGKSGKFPFFFSRKRSREIRVKGTERVLTGLEMEHLCTRQDLSGLIRFDYQSSGDCQVFHFVKMRQKVKRLRQNFNPATNVRGFLTESPWTKRTD